MAGAKLTLKPLHEQVIVVTGASSGIGLATARLAARRGARVVLTSNDGPALHAAAAELADEGGRVLAVTADVTEAAALERVAAEAERVFGGIDTWVNNAGVHVFGETFAVSPEDQRRVFDVNYWGMVYGGRTAVARLRRRGGGALINVGSVLSARSIPLQGIYTASKHALKAWTEALRTELAAEGAPISVTLVKPSAIHTPIQRHSKNVTSEPRQLPMPLYEPQVAARAILRCAQHPRRNLIVGGAGALAEFGEHFAPTIADKLMTLTLFRLQRARGPRQDEDALHEPARDDRPRERGEQDRFTLRHSAYTAAALHPWRAAGLAAGIFALSWGTWKLARS
jgi:NAD(P)-dependent dehydrogenase (short-subunit alcohol dehydrogenase family)